MIMTCVYMYRKVPRISPAPPPPTKKNGSCLNVRISVTSKVSSNVFSISETEMVPVHDYVKRYAEAFAITKIRTFKHEPFFIVGGGGGGAYSWYFTVYECKMYVTSISISSLNKLKFSGSCNQLPVGISFKRMLTPASPV